MTKGNSATMNIPKDNLEDGLALVAEVQRLRAENEQLMTENEDLRNENLELAFCVIDVSNLAFEGLIGARKDTKSVLQAIQDLADEALNGGAS